MPLTLGLAQRWGGIAPPPGTPLVGGHSLAQGLVNVWSAQTPGTLYGHLAAARMPLLLNGTPAPRISAAGPGLALTTAGQGARATVPANYQTGWPHSIVARFTLQGTPDADVVLYGLVYNDADTSPFVLCNVGYNGGTGRFQVNYNAGGSGSFNDTGVQVGGYVGQDLWMALVVTATTQTFYLNGHVAWTATASIANPSWSATSHLAFGNARGVTRNPNLVASWCGWWQRALSGTEIKDLVAEPHALYAPPLWRRYFLVGDTVQTAVPISDVSAGGWTASTGSDLYAMLDETVADDSDYILSPRAPANAEAKLRLGPLLDPSSSTGHIVRYRFYKDPDGGARGDITVTLYAADGTTTIASQTHTDVAPGVVDGSFTLSGAEADAIPSADYSTGLVLGLKANAP